MASIQRILGYNGAVEKLDAQRGVSGGYVVRITGGTESRRFAKRADAQAWLEEHGKVISTHYRAQVRVAGHPSQSETFETKRDAVEWAGSIETKLKEGKHFPHRAAQRTTFAGLVADYTAAVVPTIKGESQQATRKQQLAWWVERFNGLKVGDINDLRIIEARDALAAEKFTKGKPHRNKKTGELEPPKQYSRSPATVNRYVAALSAVLSFAATEKKLIAVNPVKGVDRKTEPRGRTRFLSDAERNRLIDACTKSEWPALHALVLLALTTGARRGELIGLTWAHVDIERGTAHVTDTKNNEQRVLPFAGSKAQAALRDLHESATSSYVFAPPSEHTEGPFEFFDKYWHAALEAARIKGFRFHDLRHTTASMLAAQGRSLLEIADVLGHKTLAMVQRYSHLVVDHKQSVIAEMIAAKGL